MNHAQKLARTAELARLHGEAERLCTAICHAIDWTIDGDRMRKLDALLRRARARAARRHQRFHRWYTQEV